jgi:hypothetical protein
MFVLYSNPTFAWECLPPPPRRNDYPPECSCRIRNQCLPYHVSASWARCFSTIPSEPTPWLRGHYTSWSRCRSFPCGILGLLPCLSIFQVAHFSLSALAPKLLSRWWDLIVTFSTMPPLERQLWRNESLRLSAAL